MERGEKSGGAPGRPGVDPWATLTAGYRFFVVAGSTDAREALDVRSRVYGQKVGSPIEVPDAFDEYTWLLGAVHTASDRIVGTMRITPHRGGPFECEEFFDLPLRFRQERAVEITRFAVLPEHRRRADSLPPVSLGLFHLASGLCRKIEADCVVIASRAEQISTYRWLGFEQTGLISNYGTLADAPHELLWLDFARLGRFEWHALSEFFAGHARPEIHLPEQLPAAGQWLRDLRRGQAASAGQAS